jgi:hypothetical protein
VYKQPANAFDWVPVTFQPGINVTAEPLTDAPYAASLGAKRVRVDIGYNEKWLETLPAIINKYAEHGIRVQPIYDFYGTLPTSAQAKELASMAKAFGPTSSYPIPIERIEFGNETSYGYQYGDNPTASSYKERARKYAQLFKEAAEAMNGLGVELLCQADQSYDSAPTTWVDEMFAQVPTLAEFASGWIVHLYEKGWHERLEKMLGAIAKYTSSTLPVEITEIGYASDNGRTLEENGLYGWLPTNPTYAEVGKRIEENLIGIKAQLGERLRGLLIYSVRDLRESGTKGVGETFWYFGALQANGKIKGAYTEAIEGIFAEEGGPPWKNATKTWEHVSGSVTWKIVKEGEI